MLQQLLQRCEFQNYDSTTSAYQNYVDPSWSDDEIEPVPLQMLLPTDPVPANISTLALPVPKNRKIYQDNSESSKRKGKEKGKAKGKGKAKAKGKGKEKAKTTAKAKGKCKAK